jgi:glyoxylase-like metal-dependent hydrolase (beta-lactamase superfamily II)
MRTGRWLPAALAVLSLGCLPEFPQKNPYLVVPPAPPAGIREIPHTFALNMISDRRPKSVTLRVFNTGQARTRGEWVSSLKSFHSKLTLDVPAFLIRNSDEGYVLFDTGLDPVEGNRPLGLYDVVVPLAPPEARLRPRFTHKQKKGQDLPSQLKAAGIRSADIRWVVLSRLDAEAAGMAMSFSSATFVVSRKEWEWRKSLAEERHRPMLLPASLEQEGRLRLVDLHVAPALAAFENAVDLFEDGSIYLVSLPGRTPGNMGAWLNLDRGPVLLTGGAAYVVDNYLDLALPVRGFFTDLEDFWRSLHIISRMRKDVPQLIAVPGNDLTPLRILPRPDIVMPAKK